MKYITGSGKYENIKGTYGSDVIDGKGGSDRIVDYNGNDQYIFNKGYGQVTITDWKGNDTIKFGSNFTPESVQFVRWNNNLMVRDRNSNDKLEVLYWFKSSTNKIEKFQFKNGKTLSIIDVESKLEKDKKVIVASSRSDKIYGSSANEIIYAMQGNDTIQSGRGNDVVECASGDDKVYDAGGNDTYYPSLGKDYIEDDNGDDTYMVYKGDGSDTYYDKQGYDVIKFGYGINRNNLKFNKSGIDLVVQVSSSDKITIKKWFNSGRYMIEEFKFNDGSVLTGSDINRSFSSGARSMSNSEINSIIHQMSAFGATSEVLPQNVNNTQNNAVNLVNTFNPGS